MKYLVILIWLLFFMIGINLSLEMVSNPSLIDNLLGIFAIFAIVFITVKTKFFTNLKIKKNEKN